MKTNNKSTRTRMLVMMLLALFAWLLPQGAWADDKLETELWDIPHSCGLKAQQRVLEFFKKHL